MFQGYAAICALLGVVAGTLTLSSAEDYFHYGWCKDEQAKTERKFLYTATAIAWILLITFVSLPIFIMR